jgi:hypothetical protein
MELSGGVRVIASPDLSGRGNLSPRQPHKIASSLPFLAMTKNSVTNHVNEFRSFTAL